MRNTILSISLILYLIDPYKIGFVFGYVIALILLININQLSKYFDRFAMLLTIFSVIYSLFYTFKPELGTQFIFIYALSPVAFYLLAQLMYESKARITKNQFSLIILALALSFTSILSVGKILLTRGFDILNRNVPNFWNGVEENATYTGGLLMLNMTFLGILLFSWKKLKSWQSITTLVIFIISLLCVLRLGSRTQLLIVVFGVITSVFYLISRQSIKKNFFLVLAMFVAINIGLGYLSLDKDSDFIAAYTDRMDSKKYGANTAGGRTERWEKSFVNLFEKPLGWELDEFGYSHNLWLDVLRVGGVLSFILLVIISFLSIKLLYEKYRSNKTIDPYLGTLTVFIVAFNLLFLVEPIFEGYFQIFVFYCFLIGLLKIYNPKIQENQKLYS